MCPLPPVTLDRIPPKAAEISCFRFSLSMMVMVPLDMADVVVVPALSFTVRPMFERSPKAFKGTPAPVL